MLFRIGILLIIAVVFYVSVTAVMRFVFRKALVTHLWTMMAPGIILMAFMAALGGKLSELGYSPLLTRGAMPCVALIIMVGTPPIAARTRIHLCPLRRSSAMHLHTSGNQKKARRRRSGTQN